MTHDELLADIDTVPRIPWAQYIAALRAVVELHKPKASGYFDEDVCETCSFDLDYFVNYPCETIQAIEKELL